MQGINMTKQRTKTGNLNYFRTLNTQVQINAKILPERALQIKTFSFVH
jgi:hypothetical protein